jgi:CHAT domain-containing protein
MLSACNSGQRAVAGREMDELPGDDVFGLQSSFAMAGARAVLGCLWPVNDKVAEEIMTEFHQSHAKHTPPDVALQRSVAGYLLRTNERHCYLWAPFFLSVLGAQANIHGGENIDG